METVTKEKRPVQREEKLMADCRALIAHGAKGAAAAVSIYRLAKRCDRQTAMRDLAIF
ncbi:MAG TPA: hypothetical protein VF616_33145 [Duganella sp.]|jgi:hypothetical protein|uniref:hypothetical protein n=1 Tax=Duganella sp. TaxID=1904440 RepID=UPI002ED56407